MGQDGRLRLGTAEVFDAELDSLVVDPTMSDEKAKENGEFIERLHDDGAQLSRLPTIGRPSFPLRRRYRTIGCQQRAEPEIAV